MGRDLSEIDSLTWPAVGETGTDGILTGVTAQDSRTQSVRKTRPRTGGKVQLAAGTMTGNLTWEEEMIEEGL